MVTLFTGYAYDVFHLISILSIQKSKFGGKSDKFAETLEIVGSRGVHGARFFQLQGPLALGGARVPSSAKWSGGQDCRGKVEGRGFVEHWWQEKTNTLYKYKYNTKKIQKKIKLKYKNSGGGLGEQRHLEH